MIIPCIDLMGGKVVQLVQGRDKALEVDSPFPLLTQFRRFPQLQVIDLDAALGTGANDDLMGEVARQAVVRAGGGVRSALRAQTLITHGAHRVIVGTAAFDHRVLEEIVSAVGRERVIIALDSKEGHVVVKGWRESVNITAEEAIHQLEPYCSGFLCTYVDKEGMMQGTDLAWFRRLRAATSWEITAAGGITTLDDVRALHEIGIHAALGMALYTGRLNLHDLEALQAAEYRLSEV